MSTPATFVTRTALDRITATRRANAELRQPERHDVERPPGPPRGEIWRAVARGEVPSLQFFERFVPYRPLAYVRMPRGDFYYLNDPDLIWDLFVTADVIKGFGLQQARAVVGDGILTSQGDKHRRHRSMVQPAFTGRRIASYTDAMRSAVADLDERWGRSDGRTEVLPDMTTLTLDIVGRTLFGIDLTAVSDRIAGPLNDALAVFNRTINPTWELLSRYPSRPRRRLTHAVDQLDAVVADIVTTRRDQLATGTGAPDDMLTVLLEAVDPETGAPLTDDELRDEVMTLLVAGHETTSMLLTWTWLLLFANPAAKDWVIAEWDATGDDAGLADLPRTHAVLAESMRLYPPAWVVDRLTTADTVVGDWVVPVGESVIASQATMHRDDRFWARPDAFDPTRWLDATGSFTDKIVPRGVYFPFGFAARKCIGDRFALTEAAIALSYLGRRWHVLPTSPQQVVPHPQVTLRPSTPVPAVLRPRR